MKTIINKRPASKYLEARTFTISEREYDIMVDSSIPSEIVVHTGENVPVYTIKKSKYKKLVCSSRTAFDEDGIASTYYVVDFSGAI